MDEPTLSPTGVVRAFFDAQGRSDPVGIEALLDPSVRWQFDEQRFSGRASVLDQIAVATDRHPEHLDRLVGWRLVDGLVEVDHEVVLRDVGVRDPRVPSLVSTFAVADGRIIKITTRPVG